MRLKGLVTSSQDATSHIMCAELKPNPTYILVQRGGSCIMNRDSGVLLYFSDVGNANCCQISQAQLLFSEGEKATSGKKILKGSGKKTSMGEGS